MKSANPRITGGHVPFVRFLLALLLGVGAGIAVPPDLGNYRLLQGLAGLLAVGFVVLFFVRSRRSAGFFPWLGLVWLAFLFLCGWILLWHTDPKIDQRHFSRHTHDVLVGYITDEPVLRNEHVRFPVTVTGGYRNDTLNVLTGQLLLTVRLDSAKQHGFAYGTMLVVPARFEEVAPPYNPGELDYRRYLANKNIWHQAYVRDAGDVRLLASFQGKRIIAYALAVRQQMVAKFGRYLAHPDAYSIASTLILGYRADLSQDLLSAFSATGTIHVLSVSGMHVVIVFWLLSKLLWWMDASKSLRFSRWALMLLCIWAYALITGFSPSVLRAAIMISFVITATHFSRQARVYNSIAASAFFLLLYNAKFVLDVGFQLSYLAVLSIVFLLPLLQQAFPVRQRFVRPVWDYSLMSIAAQAGAFPLATFYFNQFPVYFLPANLLIVIPASFIMYLGFALLLVPFDPLCQWLGIGLERLILFMNEALLYIEHLPFSSMRGVWLDSWEYVVMYALMLAIVFAVLQKSKRLVYATCLCLLMLFSSSFVANTRKSVEKQLVIYNVRGNLAIGLMHRGKVLLYTNLPSIDDRTIQYSVMPHLEYYASADQIAFVPKDSTYQWGSVFIQSGVLQWDNKRLFVYEGDPVFASTLPVDVLLLRGNPRRKLVEIVASLPCQLLVLDGSNYDNTIARIRAEAESLGVPVYVLKNNFTYVWQHSE